MHLTCLEQGGFADFIVDTQRSYPGGHRGWRWLVIVLYALPPLKHCMLISKGCTHSLVEKLSFMTILCHFGCVIPNIHINLDMSSEHSCHIGPFSYHIGHFLSFWIVSQKTMFPTSDSRTTHLLTSRTKMNLVCRQVDLEVL